MEAFKYKETQEFCILLWWKQESLFLVVVDLLCIPQYWLVLDIQLLEDNLEIFQDKNRKLNF